MWHGEWFIMCSVWLDLLNFFILPFWPRATEAKNLRNKTKHMEQRMDGGSTTMVGILTSEFVNCTATNYVWICLVCRMYRKAMCRAHRTDRSVRFSFSAYVYVSTGIVCIHSVPWTLNSRHRRELSKYTTHTHSHTQLIASYICHV